MEDLAIDFTVRDRAATTQHGSIKRLEKKGAPPGREHRDSFDIERAGGW